MVILSHPCTPTERNREFVGDAEPVHEWVNEWMNGWELHGEFSECMAKSKLSPETQAQDELCANKAAGYTPATFFCSIMLFVNNMY